METLRREKIRFYGEAESSTAGQRDALQDVGNVHTRPVSKSFIVSLPKRLQFNIGAEGSGGCGEGGHSRGTVCASFQAC